MFTLLLTLLILDGILMMVVILLQAGKGGGLAAMGGGGAGTDTFMGGRQAATVLTKTTWATGAVFIGLALVLSVMSSQRQDPTPLLQQQFQQQTAPQPILPGGEGEAGEGIPLGPGPAGAVAPEGGTSGGDADGGAGGDDNGG